MSIVLLLRDTHHITQIFSPSEFLEIMSLGTVLVFGGSSGIGLGIATEVIKSGSRVVIASSSQSKIDKVVASLNELAGETRAFGHVADLSDEHTLEQNVLAVLKYASSNEVTRNTSGKINHIAHTAGDSLSRVTLKEWTPVNSFKSWTVRYLTALTIGKHGPDYLVNSDKSSITFTTGTLAAKPTAGTSVFIGSAAALEATGRALAVELAPIRVNVVAPGAIATPMMDGYEAHNPGIIEGFKQDNLLKKLGSPEDSAQPYLYFMRDTFQTGAVLRNDGGRLLRS